MKAGNSFQEEGNPREHSLLQDGVDLDIRPLNDVHKRVVVLHNHQDLQDYRSRCQVGGHILAANNREDILAQEVAADDSLDDLTRNMNPDKGSISIKEQEWMIVKHL